MRQWDGWIGGQKNGQKKKTQARVIEEDGFPFDYGSNFQTGPPGSQASRWNRRRLLPEWGGAQKKKRASSVIDSMGGGGRWCK